MRCKASIVWFLFLTILTPFLSANESKEPLLIARGDDDYPPYEMYVGGKLTGLHIELIRGAAKIVGRDVVFTSHPWKRAIRLLKNGQVDATTYMGKTPERERFTTYLEGNSLSHSKPGFMILDERKSEIRYRGDLKALSPFIIGVERGYYYSERFNNAEFLKREPYDGIESLLQMLRKRRIDIAVYSKDYFLWEQKKNRRFDGVIFLSPTLKGATNYLGFSRVRMGADELAIEFSEAMTSFKQTSEYQAILDRYGLQE